jgi:hypothetical protein
VNVRRWKLRAGRRALLLVPPLAAAAGVAVGLRLGDGPDVSPTTSRAEAPRPGLGREEAPLWERVATAPDAAACADLAEEVAAVANRSDRDRWRRLLFAVWCQHDGPGAFAAVAGWDDPGALAGLVREWALADPDAAASAVAAAVAGGGGQGGADGLEAALAAGLAAGHPERFFARGRNQAGFGANLRRAALALAARDPAAALTQLEEFGDDPYGKLARDVVASALAAVWGRSEPAAATAWVQRAVDEGNATVELLEWLVEAVGTTDPVAAAALIAPAGPVGATARTPAPPRREGDLRAPVPPDPFAAVGRGLVRRELPRLAEILGQIGPVARERVAVGAATGIPAGTTTAELADLLGSVASIPDAGGLPALVASAWAGADAATHAREAARLPGSAGRDVLLGAAIARWAEADAAGAAEFLRGLPDAADRARAGTAALDRPGLWAQAGDVVSVFDASGLERLPTRFVGLLPGDGFPAVAESAERRGDRDALGEVVGRWVRIAPGAAARWATGGDGARRPARLRAVFTAWADDDPDLARAEFGALDLTPGERELVGAEAGW